MTAPDSSTLPVCLVVGGAGELGQQVIRACLKGEAERMAQKPIHVVATYYNTDVRDELPPNDRLEWVRLNVSDKAQVRELLDRFGPRLAAVIYCAVPKHQGAAAKDTEALHRGIVEDVKNFAQESCSRGARFVVLSTDQVWDGRNKPHPLYSEQDPTCACLPYGQAKANMEQELLKLQQNIVIARTSLIMTIYPRLGKSLQFVLDCMEERPPGQPPMTIFTDEPRNMSFSDDLALALLELALRPDCDYTGLLNLAGPEILNRYELAELLIKYGVSKTGSMANVRPGLSAESGLNRPLDLSLDVSLSQRLLKHARVRGATEYLADTVK